MSDTALFWFGLFVLAVLGAIVAYIIIGSRKAKKRSDGYQWQPEQDYDVVQTGGANMTPPFPVLKKRKDAPKHVPSDPLSKR